MGRSSEAWRPPHDRRMAVATPAEPIRKTPRGGTKCHCVSFCDRPATSRGWYGRRGAGLSFGVARPTLWRCGRFVNARLTAEGPGWLSSPALPDPNIGATTTTCVARQRLGNVSCQTTSCPNQNARAIIPPQVIVPYRPGSRKTRPTPSASQSLPAFAGDCPRPHYPEQSPLPPRPPQRAMFQASCPRTSCPWTWKMRAKNPAQILRP